MMKHLYTYHLIALIISLLVLSACENSEERAQKHFASALALVEEGDLDRAIVELRNVFKLNNTHRDARFTFAQIQQELGNDAAAHGQYLRLVEQYPDDTEGLKALSDLSLKRLDWASLARFAPRALEKNPEDASLQNMVLLTEYQDARRAEDQLRSEQIAQSAQDALEKFPQDIAARYILIDAYVRKEDFESVLREVHTLLQRFPNTLYLHDLKLRALGSMQNIPAMGPHLEEMVVRFPDNQRIRQLLISWYLDQNDLEGAEDFLRSLAASAEEGLPKREAETTLVRFIQRAKGDDAAFAELDNLIETGDNTLFHKTFRALLKHETGHPTEAIDALQTAIKDSKPSTQLNDSKAVLAQMLVRAGDNVGARNLIEEILSQDSSHVAALQMNAAWLIEADKPSDAIQALRTALNQEPRNAQTLTLIAQAHLREGNLELAGDRLALAVDVTDSGVEESIRYARYLSRAGKPTNAEQVLLGSLRRNPENVQLLANLGSVYLGLEDWIGAERVLARLDAQTTSQARQRANQLRNALLLRQNRTEESIEFLQQLIDDGEAGVGANAAIVQNMLRNGELERAETHLDDLLEATPNDQVLRHIPCWSLRGNWRYRSSRTDLSQPHQRKPTELSANLSLFGMLWRLDRIDEAITVINDGINTTGGNVDMLFAKASYLERIGQFEEAITIYEDLYASNSGNLLFANNLASMLTTYRSDQDSLERALIIAQRLRDTKIPAIQDTYGWIAHRRGDIGTALEYLEPAAEGLPRDPRVHMHLGLAYVSAERWADARKALTYALEISSSPLPPHMVKALDALDALPAPTSE